MALENVTSHGTEGRKTNPDEEIPASESVYEYIVFRGSDVKDLRIEEAPVAKENKPPQVPNDPAILGVSYASLLYRLCTLLYLTKLLGDEIFRMLNHYCLRERKTVWRFSVAFLLTKKAQYNCLHLNHL